MFKMKSQKSDMGTSVVISFGSLYLYVCIYTGTLHASLQVKAQKRVQVGNSQHFHNIELGTGMVKVMDCLN